MCTSSHTFRIHFCSLFHHGCTTPPILRWMILCFSICAWCWLIITVYPLEATLITLKFYPAYCKHRCYSILLLIWILASVKHSKLLSVIKQNYVIKQCYKSKLLLATHSTISFCANFVCSFFMEFQENISLGSDEKIQL